MLVNVFSWRRVYIIGIALLMFLKKTAELGRRMCVYMCNSMHTRVCNVGLMYVHVYVTAPQSKWSLPHLIWWHHRANEGSLFVPSSHFTWWLHRTNEGSLFMPLPPFIWQHHRANEGSLFMPSPHFNPCFQTPILQICNWLHHWKGAPYLCTSVCRYCLYRPHGVSTLCKVCKKLQVLKLLKQHSSEKHT